MLKVNEIFRSIVGEGSFSGTPCTFIRLAGCNLRCSWCDTAYAYENGIEMSVEQIVRTVRKYDILTVMLTGGEPLLQDEVFVLMEALYDHGFVTLLETNGSVPVKNVPGDVITIMDVKCPGSGQEEKNLYDNLDFLADPDIVKFVLTDEKDYFFALDVIDDFELTYNMVVYMSPVHGLLSPVELAEWMVRDKLAVRLSLQLHKIIWGPDVQGK